MSENGEELKQVSVTAEELLLLEKARSKANVVTEEEAVDNEDEINEPETDELEDEQDIFADFGNEVDSEIEDDDSDEEESDAASKIELSLDDVKVDEEHEEDEYSYLFEEDSSDADDNTKATDTTAEADNNVEQTQQSEYDLPKHLQAGTAEYFRAIKTYAEGMVSEKLGKGGDGEPIEYDPFDDEHRVMFDHFVSEGKKLVSEKSKEIKDELNAKKLKDSASKEIDTILGEELGPKFVAICENMKVKDMAKLKDAADKGDYSGFIKLAERVKKTYGKAKQIKEKSKTTRLKKKGKTDSIDDSLAFMGF